MPTRILIVEDSDLERDAIQRVLAKDPEGYDISAVPSVSDALALLSTERFDLLVLDHHLGSASGLDLMRTMKNLGLDAPVIYVTAAVGLAVIEEALALGATHYLAKDSACLKLLGPLVRRSLILDRLRREGEMAVRELRQRERSYRNLVESADELMFQMSSDLRVLFVNRALEHLLGHSPSSIPSHPAGLAPILAPRCREILLASWQSMFDTGVTHELEAEFLTRSGDVRLLSLRHRLHDREDATEETPVLEVVGRDITLDRELTRALEKEKGDLLQVNEELSKQTRIRGDFLSKVSHELRSPMSAILGYTDCMIQGLDGPTSKEQQDSLERIRRNATRMMSFVSDLLNLSRLESREISLKRSRVPVGSLLSRVIEERAAELKPNVAVRVSCPPELCIQADETLLGQALSHLVKNAFRYTSRGEVSLDARIDSRSPDYLQISVSDTGPGIEASLLGVIFEPFRQASEGLSRCNEGAGLGLSLADQLVRLHHGHIEVESRAGLGSTFRVRLPIHTPEEIEDRFQDIDPLLRTGSVVLVVDRDAESLALVSKILESAKMGAVGVRTVGHALSILARVRPKAVLVDLFTAHQDSPILFSRMREESAERGVPVLSMITQGEQPVLSQVETTELLEKPFKPRQMVARIRQIVSSERLEDCLIVDDEREVLDLYETVLRNEGVPLIRRATDGFVALEEIGKKRPDLMILDLAMPEMDGLELIRRLRAEETTRDLPIVVVTATAVSQGDSCFLRSHVCHVVRKGDAAALASDLIRLVQEAAAKLKT